jgi:hypothetical protein
MVGSILAMDSYEKSLSTLLKKFVKKFCIGNFLSPDPFRKWYFCINLLKNIYDIWMISTFYISSIYMTCLECLNATSVVDNRCAELTNSYPYLIDAAPIRNVQHLSNVDIDVEIPSDSNFEFYSTHDFHSDYDISECFNNNLCFSALQN